MATQFDPIAKDESLNTTESPSRNVADVLAQGLDAIEQAIASGSGSGGHTIVNASGTDMTQRAKMQFVDAGVTDDSANNKTKVEVVQLIDAESELTNAPDGVYQGDYEDAPEDVLNASMVAYKDGSVEDALDELSSIPIKQFTIASNATVTLASVFCVMFRTSGTASGLHIVNVGWGTYSYALGGTSTGCTLSASGYNLTITNNNAYSIACAKIMNAI